MYKDILFCLDNSDYANTGIDIGLAIAKTAGSRLTGCHVYAAQLHNDRFLQMESGLPPKYQNEQELQKQREIHDTLITKGLRIISDSYMTVLQAKVDNQGLQVNGVSREGKNYEELVKEANEGPYDLVVAGALGLGKVGTSRIGSVTERLVRRCGKDILITRDTPFKGKAEGKIVVGIDGSPAAFGGLLTALEISKILDCKVEAISAFDPDFHYTAFRSIAGVLTEEAGKLFKFKEQEKLHEEVIDKGLAKIYQDHLNAASELAKENGYAIETKLLSGKAHDEIIKYVRSTSPFLLIVGKTGVHSVPGLDIGSTTENCLREAGCHILVSSREAKPAVKEGASAKPMPWTEDAAAILERVPNFVKGVVKNMVDEAARREGLTEITKEFMLKVREKMGGGGF